MLRKIVKNLVLSCAILTVLFTTETCDAKTYKTPGNSSWKTFMDSDTIKTKSTNQWRLKQMYVTSDYGIRTFNGRYAIAIGTAFNVPAGTYVDVKLSTGKVLPCIVGDIKRDCDTGADNMQVPVNGNVVEFIVDTETLAKSAKIRGNLNVLPELEGDIVSITTCSFNDVAELSWDKVTTDVEDSGKYLVTNKYTLDTSRHTEYIVEYASDTGYQTMSISADKYNNIVVGKSSITP